MNSLRAMVALAKLDLKLWFKAPAAVATALLPPLAMALLLAVLSVTVTEQPVALVVESHGPYANRLEQLIRSDEEAYFLWTADAKTAERYLEEQQVAAIITIPADFDQKAAKYQAVVHLKLNNIDIDFADDIRRSVDRSVGQFDAPALGAEEEPEEAEEGKEKKESDAKKEEEAQAKEGSPLSVIEKVEGQGNGGKTEEELEEEEEAAAKSSGPYAFYVDPKNNPYHIEVEEHDLRVTDVDFLHYQLVPVLVLLVLNIGMVGTALLCAGDGERGTARLLVVSPVSSWALVGGRMLGGLLASILVLIPVIWICLATKTIHVPKNHWPALVALLLVIALCAAGLGAVMGTVVRGARNVAMAASVLATYLFLMGGGFTTIAFLPQWLRNISALDPMRYAVDGLREVLFYPDLTGFATNIAVLTGTAAGAVLLGAVLVVRSWSR